MRFISSIQASSYIVQRWSLAFSMSVEPIDLHYGTHIHSRADYLDALRKHGFGAIEVDDRTEEAIPYWELRCQWQHRSGVELDFLLGHRERKILYLFIHGTLA